MSLSSGSGILGSELEDLSGQPVPAAAVRPNTLAFLKDKLVLLSIARAHDVYEKVTDAVKDEENPNALRALTDTRQKFLDWLIGRFMEIEIEPENRPTVTSNKSTLNNGINWHTLALNVADFLLCPTVNVLSVGSGEQWVNVILKNETITVLRSLSGLYFQDQTGEVRYLEPGETLQVGESSVIPVCAQFSHAVIFAMEYFGK